MQRDNRDNDEIRVTERERERRDMNNARKNPDPMSQLLMWLLPALLLGILTYYIYQRYYMPTAKETPVTTAEVRTTEATVPAATTAEEAKPLATTSETKPASAAPTK